MNEMIPILLAEDDDNDVFFMKRAFADAEIKNPVHIVHDGQEAIDYLSGVGEYSDRAKYPLPGLVITDLKMPRKTGLELLEWKREHAGLCRLPALVLSSSAHRHDIERAYELGANAFVVKPGSTSERARLLSLIKAFWLEFSELPSLENQGRISDRSVHAYHER